MLVRIAENVGRIIIFAWDTESAKVSRFFGIFSYKHPARAALIVWLRNNGIEGHRIISGRAVQFANDDDYILAMISFRKLEIGYPHYTL